jgi:transposase
MLQILESGMPAAGSRPCSVAAVKGVVMAAVMIGVDPHKASHTAGAIGPGEEPLGQVRIRARAGQAEQLVAWAQGWPERIWAVEGAGGLGRLLAQQLVAAGERVVDVQPKVAARVRLLAAGNTNKTDANDARSVAVAALRSAARREVGAEDHRTVLAIWAKRHRDLSRARTQVACRLHAVLCDLVPGGFSKEISAGQGANLLERIAPAGAVGNARWELAGELLADLRYLDAQLRGAGKHLAGAVTASGSSLTGIFGVGPVIAATIIGVAGDVSRFASQDHFAAYNGTAPIEVSSGGRKTHRLSLRGNRRLNHAIHMVAVTQIRYPHSPGRAYFDRKRAEGKTGKEALRALKRKISNTIYARLRADTRQRHDTRRASPGGQRGNGSITSAAGSHPQHRLFGQATPGPATHTTAPASSTAHASLSRTAATSREQAAGSRTGRSPAAQRRPRGRP